MSKKDDVSLKEKYRLWWEYVKRSKDFKELEEWYQQYSKKYPPPQGIPYGTRRLRKPWAEYCNRQISRVPARLRGIDGNCRMLGVAESVANNKRGGFILPPAAVEDLQRWNDPYENSIIKAYLKPPIKKIDRNNYAQYLILFVVVDLTKNRNIQSLGEEFKELVRKKKGEPRVKKSLELHRKLWMIPTMPFHFEDIKRYLRVYDLKEQDNPKLKLKEIAPQIYPNLEWSESLKRTILLDFSKAKRIIKNVEKGIFPGRY